MALLGTPLAYLLQLGAGVHLKFGRVLAHETLEEKLLHHAGGGETHSHRVHANDQRPCA